MTAQEARILTDSNKKTIRDIKVTIESMAKSGYDYAAFRLAEIQNPEEIKTSLTTDGFNCEISELHFRVTW